MKYLLLFPCLLALYFRGPLGRAIEWWWKREENSRLTTIIKRLTLFMSLWSVGLIILSGILGIFSSINFKIDDAPGVIFHFDGFSKVNWLLFPLYWPVICGLSYLTWDAFGRAWEGIGKNGVLKEQGNAVSDEALNEIRKKLESYRVKAFIPAVLLASGLVILDASDVIKLYLNYPSKNPLSTIYEEFGHPQQIIITNGAMDTSEIIRTVTETNFIPNFGKENRAPASDPFNLLGNVQLDFTIASFIPANFQELPSSPCPNKMHLPPCVNIWFNVLVYAQELVIAAVGLLILAQVCIQCFVFCLFNRLGDFHHLNLKIELDPYSPLHEFGLESWNQVLNNIYWIFSVALLIPIASRYSQADAQKDAGQWILQLLVPLLIAAPMLITIIGRQQLLSEIVGTVAGYDPSGRKVDESQQEKETRIKEFHEQRLWPLDKNWASKLGIVLAFLLLSFLLGVNLLSATSGG